MIKKKDAPESFSVRFFPPKNVDTFIIIEEG